MSLIPFKDAALHLTSSECGVMECSNKDKTILVITAEGKIFPFGDKYKTTLKPCGNGMYNIALVATCSLILLAIGADLFGFSLVVTAACDLNLTVGQKGVMTSLPFVGILLVSYFWGYISDTRGRRFTLLLSLPLGCLLSCLSSFSPNWVVMAIGKFLAVCFSCAPNSATYTLVGESCGQRVRNRYMLLMTCMLLFSPGFAAILSYPTLKMTFATHMPWLGIDFRPWRLLCVILAIPSGLGGLAIYFFHESPKFLANCGKKEEALNVLKQIYATNNRNSTVDIYKVEALNLEDRLVPSKEKMGCVKMMWEQSAPLFRPPLLKRTAQLFYIVAVVYITNNSFLVWLPHVMNLVKHSLETGGAGTGNLCYLITSSVHDANTTLYSTNATAIPAPQAICKYAIEDNTMWTLCGSSAVFCFLNFVISHLQNRRKAVLMGTLTLSALSAICINLVQEPISSVLFFMLFTITCLGMGILASYFVDFYPTSYRGMVACLSIMVGRTSTFVGINLVGNVLFKHCTVVFYVWSLLVFSSVVAAWYLPPDKTPEAEDTKL